MANMFPDYMQVNRIAYFPTLQHHSFWPGEEIGPSHPASAAL